MKLFLSSEGIPRVDLLKELVREAGGNLKVAVINNAQDPYPEQIAKERGAALMDQFASFGFQPLDIDLRMYEGRTDALARELRACGLVWCSGGNAFWLRYVMRLSGFDAVIKELVSDGLIYGGWSAGSVVAGPSLKCIELMDETNAAPEIVWEGLGLVEYFIWPHWDKDKYLPLQPSAMEMMKTLPYEAVILRDGEALRVDDQGRVLVS